MHKSFIKGIIEILYIFYKSMFTFIRGPYRFREIITYISQMGIGSLPIIVIATAFAGTVVTSEIGFHMNVALHTTEMLPGISGQFIFREFGIAIPALLLVAKVGASTTAEVGSMKITEQIDALKLLQIDPIEYLVYPRFIASILVVTCLTVIALFVTLSCAIAVATWQYNFSTLEYLNHISHFLSFKDLLCALTKGACFGAIIPIISCFYGFNCTGGAQGVGSATTQSVVTSTMVVIVVDFLLTYMFSLIL